MSSIVRCTKCKRSYEVPGDDPNTKISHTYCARCYILFPEGNGGIDWRSATPAELKQLKEEISSGIDKEDNFTGESEVEWPADGLAYVESMIQEIKNEREARDGSRL